MEPNFLLMTDSYKVTHPLLYPEGMTEAYAYFESRGGRYERTVFFGLQYYINKYLVGKVFDLKDIDEAEDFWRKHFQRFDCFPRDKWVRLYEKYKGKLPLTIYALPEGSIVETHNPLFTVKSNDPEFAWLVGFVETILMKVWYPITIATQSWHLKNQIRTLRERWSSDLEGLDFMVHDFGYRGVSSEETASIGGAAHLLSFKGTDTVAGIRMLQEYYYDGNSMYGYSVPATEHSVILSFPSEEEAFEHALDTFPTGIVSCVSDTYNIYQAVDHLWGSTLQSKVLERDGTLVVRPDSGDPFKIVPWVLFHLWLRFGGTSSREGLLVLNSKVRVIQGDGMDWESIPRLYETIIREGFAPENLVVGAGGGMLQSVNRDTQRFAYKISQVTVDGVKRNVSKSPITDPQKASKAGRVVSIRTQEGYKTYTDDSPDMVVVFFNGSGTSFNTVNSIQTRMEQDA